MSERCDWCLGDDRYIEYHDREWGFPQTDKGTLFEFLILEGAQAGLAWITILRKREHYADAFEGFDAARVARFGSRDVDRLMNSEGIVRNRRKIESAIGNARAWCELSDPAGFLWSFVDGVPIQNRRRSMADVPTTTETARAMSKALKKSGFSFVGPTICYAFMQATGMVNDHLVTCPRYEPCRAAGLEMTGT
ncbi:MAG: DNA-3-methyladenine glycosylase I [Gammaproteobacteria bacterium]|nr:DNA-3-methyladenine glycosylase I [Gammaproteobacteria bacterium]